MTPLIRRVFAVFRLMLLISLTLTVARAAPGASANRPWVFFDLGENSLVTTPKDSSGDITAVAWIRYQAPGGATTDAHTYLSTLRAHGYQTGVIINIPADWGDPDLSGARAWLAATDPDRKAELARGLTAAKIEVLQDFFEGHAPGDATDRSPRWRDAAYPAMEFSLFTRENILLPFLTGYRKPMDGPARSTDEMYLYRQAIALAAKHGCQAIYQGADPNDVANAQKAGMITRLLPYRPGQSVQAADYYLSEAQLDQLSAGQQSKHGPGASRPRALDGGDLTAGAAGAPASAGPRATVPTPRRR